MGRCKRKIVDVRLASTFPLTGCVSLIQPCPISCPAVRTWISKLCQADALSAVESVYTLYLHHDTLSANAEKRQQADLNVQFAMRIVREEVIAYGREIGVGTWKVLIV